MKKADYGITTDLSWLENSLNLRKLWRCPNILLQVWICLENQGLVSLCFSVRPQELVADTIFGAVGVLSDIMSALWEP